MVLMMVAICGITIAGMAYADYEFGDPYPVRIAPVEGKFHYKHGDTIEFLLEFNTGVSCDQGSEMPALTFIDSNDNLIILEWYQGANENQYFKLALTGSEEDGAYSLFDYNPNTCETGNQETYYAGNNIEFFRSHFPGHIVIDNVAPEIESARVTTNTSHQIVFNVDETIDFEVTMNEDIGHPEQLSILLNNGGIAYYAGKTNDHTLQFSYVVQANQDTNQLDTVRLEGTFEDIAGNQAAPAAKEFTLNNNPGVIVDTTDPVITVDLTSATNYAQTHEIQLHIEDRDAEPTVFHLWNQSSTQPNKDAITGVGAASGQAVPHPGSVDGDYYVHIRAMDDVGNEAIATFGPYRFDHEPPTVTFSDVPQASNQPITITITAMDNLSGVQQVAYRWQGEGDPLIAEQATFDVTTPNDDGLYTLEVTVTDLAGNTGSHTSGPYTIDLTPPQVEFSKHSDSTPSQIHAVDISVTDLYVGDAQVFVQWTEDANFPTGEADWKLVHDGNLPWEQTVSSPPADGSLHVHVKAIDGLGNVARVTTTGSFLLDNTPPDVKFIPDGNNGIYTPTADVQLQIDGSVTDFTGYQITYVISPESTVDEASIDWLTSTDGSLSITGRSGEYYVHVQVTDEAGNRTIDSSKPFAVDHLPPTGSVSFTTPYTNETDVLVELWADDNITSSLLDVSYSLNDGIWNNWVSYTQHLPVNLDHEQEGIQHIAVKYRDSAGNESEVYTAETVYDTTPPTVVELTYNPPLTVWTNESVEVTLHYTDDFSPKGVVSQSFTDNGNYTIEYFDLAGNRSTYDISITNIDKEKPNIQFSTNGSTVAQQAVSSTIIATDNVSSGSDLSVFYGWSSSPVTEPLVWTELLDGDHEVHLADEDDSWYLWAKASDEAGNEQIATSASFLLDNTPPTAVITYDPSTRTANEVTARISFDEVATILEPASGSTEMIFTDNGEFTFEFVDVAGNSATATAIVDWMDDSLPSAQVIRTPNSWTNEDVEITLSVEGSPPRQLTNIEAPPGSELIRLITKEHGEITALPIEGATVTEAVYRLTDNGVITYTITDLETGITNTEERVTVDYIDRILPIGELIYSHTAWTNQDVIVTLQAHDDRTNVTVVGESTYRFTSNGSHTFQFRDEAGNVAEKTAVVDFIDKEVPNAVVTFDHATWTTANVTASIAFDNETELVQILNNNGNSTYTFEENGQVTIQYKDIAGNVGQTTIIVDWIDRVAPTGYLTYSTTEWTNEDVTVTLHAQDNSGESVIFIVEGNEGGNQHTFTANGEFTFEVMDRAGNRSSFTAVVQRIDRTPPQAEVFYSTTTPTNAAVQVTISPDKQVTVLNNEGRTFYNFTDNGQFTFMIVDRAGNMTHVHTEVDWIDREPPIPQITYSTTQSTHQQVIATVTANEPFYVQNNNRSTQYVFTENGSFTFYIEDLAGNQAEIVAVVNNIDSSRADIQLVYSETEPTTADVTVEVVSDRPLTFLNNHGSPIVTFQQNGIFRLEATDSLGHHYLIPIEVDHIDRIHPQIRFDQGSQLLINQGEGVFPLLGVEAYDNLDGDMTDKIIVDHNIDSSISGEYKLIYRVQDRAGNETIVERTALVLAVDDLIAFVNGQTPTTDGFTLRTTEISLQIFAERGDVTVRWSEGRRYIGDFKMIQAQLTDNTLKIERQNYYSFLIEDQERQYVLIHVYVIPTN